MPKNVLVITAKHFQDEEYIYAYHRLKEEGYNVDVATPAKEIVYGIFGVPAKPTVSIIEALNHMKTLDCYDALVIPGGFEAPGRLRCIPEVSELVNLLNNKGKIIGAICHAPSVLITANIVNGHRIAGYLDIEADIRNAGATYVHRGEAVVSKNIVTSWHYDCNGPFMKAVVNEINKR